MSTKTLQLSDRLHDYLLEASLREPDVLRQLREETAVLSNAGMQISPEQGQFMRLLVQISGARRALEIGVFTGYSALSVALALPKDGTLVACDVNDEWTGIARRYWQAAGIAHKIDLRLAPALETLQALLDAGEAESFDFAFIDADKPSYPDYYEGCLALLRPGGLLAVDNVLWSGCVADPNNQEAGTQLIRAFNRALHADARIDLSLVPIGDGLTLARKR